MTYKSIAVVTHKHVNTVSLIVDVGFDDGAIAMLSTEAARKLAKALVECADNVDGNGSGMTATIELP